MSKREGTPKVPENTPEQKKPKLNEGDAGNRGEGEAAAPQERPKSPIPGPSTAPSDPKLQSTVQTGLVPIYRYFNPKVLQESSSQDSTSIDFGISSSSASASVSVSDTPSSILAADGATDSGRTNPRKTNPPRTKPRTRTTQPMQVDSETTTTTTSTNSSSTNTQQRRRRRHRKHKSRRDH